MVRKYVRFVFISGLVVLLDQFSKLLVLHYMPLHHSIHVIPGFFSLTHVHNPGGAFGFMAQNSSPLRHWLFLTAAFFALAMILYFYHQTPRSRPLFGAALGLIFGGAVGNLIDRLRHGEVVDFLDLYIGYLHWPTFNIADSAVTIGVIIFIMHILFKKSPI
ncbi:MAG: signal peptidase II [Desulfobacteraceae bacterium]|nr:MAG: signal peptidase II [Desulfobacteraceae bacterium]